MARYVFMAFLLGFASSYFWIGTADFGRQTQNNYSAHAESQRAATCPKNSRVLGFLVPSGHGDGGVICNYDSNND